MLTPEQVSALREQAGYLVDPVNDYLLQDIARRIAGAGQLTSSAAYQVWRAQQLGISQREIKRELRKLLKVSHRDLRKLLSQAAEVGYNYDLQRFPQVQAVAFHKNESLRQIVAAMTKLADDDFTAITKSLGFLGPNGEPLPLREAYTRCMDHAFKLVSTGATDYNTAIRKATRHLAEKGVLHVDYASGVHTSLEAAVRRSVMGGLGLMVEQTQQVTHDQLGCNGWEISAHAASAPDHEPIQGKQYTDKQFLALNSSLRRRISTLNCGHIAFPIILGVNAPQYSERQLEHLREENQRGVSYAGRQYTTYEATQMQRKLERRIRAQRRQVLVDESAGDVEALTRNQIMLRRLQNEYQRFSRGTGLPTQPERLQKAGFGRGPSARAIQTGRDFDTLRAHLRGLQASNGVIIGDISPHFFGQMKARGVSEEAVTEALTSPLQLGKIRIDKSQQLVGAHAAVVVNTDTGKLITVWKKRLKAKGAHT